MPQVLSFGPQSQPLSYCALRVKTRLSGSLYGSFEAATLSNGSVGRNLTISSLPVSFSLSGSGKRHVRNMLFVIVSPVEAVNRSPLRKTSA